MNWLLPASAATCLAIAILAMTNWYIYSRYRQRFMLRWSVAWTLSCLRYACMVVALSTHPHWLLDIGYYAFAVMHARCNLLGSLDFLQRAAPRYVTATAIACLFWVVIAVGAGVPDFWLQVPLFAFLSCATIITGLSFLRARQAIGGDRRLAVAVGWLLVLWGIHQADYPFLRPVAWFAPYGFLLSALFGLAAAIGILTLYFERAHDEATAHAKAAAESEQRFRRLAEGTPDAIFLHDREGRVLDVNEAACQSLGYSREELLSMSVSDFEAEVTRADSAALWQSISLGHPVRQQGRHRRRDGSTFAVEVNLTALTLDPPVLFAAARDVTERNRSAVALSESLSRFDTAFQTAPVIMAITDLATGRYLEVNEEALRVAGYERDEVIGQTATDIGWLTPEDRAAMLELLERDGRLAGLEMTFHAKDGHPIVGLVHGERITMGERACLLTVTADITQRKEDESERERLNEQLQQAQRLESIGRLAGGVAHDFNNMLQAILGNVDLALAALPADSPVREYVEEVQHSAERSTDLTRQLLGFARRQTIVPRVLDLNDAVEGTLRMLRRLIGEDIALDWRPGARLSPVRMDPGQVDQVLINLTVNARDAIGGVGLITLATTSLDGGQRVRLSITDTGAGIDQASQAHLFEPFFSTKAHGQGTGLGLATVYGIITQNGGAISVESELGRGATFHIDLPAADDPIATPIEVPAERPAGEAVDGGGETLLVVEDELQVLRLTERTLRGAGYRVLAAATPVAALALAEEADIDLLVTDMIMPEMTGRELASRLRERQPALPTLFVTGYDADMVGEGGHLPPCTDALTKPFSRAQLTAAVRRLLGTPPR